MIIKGGRVYDYKSGLNGEKIDIRVEGETIMEIGRNIPGNDEKIIEADGLFVIPGLVDMHAHFRVPGQEHKEDFETGSHAAAKGGITTALAMPNTQPPIDQPSMVADLYKRIKRESVMDIRLSACMTLGRAGEKAVDFAGNLHAGCIAFSDDGNGIQNERMMLELSELALKNNTLLIEHTESELLSGNAPISYGKLEDILQIKGQPAEAESLDILKFGVIAGMIGARIHFTHISTHKSVEAIRMLKRTYPGRVSADTTPHHLSLSEDDNLIPDTNKKMNPPLRPESDRVEIERGLVFGSIDAIATDHAPHTAEEKNRDFIHAPFGTIGFETFLPVTFTHLVTRNRLSVREWVKLVSYKPAHLLGLHQTGALIPGRRADIVLFDPQAKIFVDENFFVSKSKNSAFSGKELKGKVMKTIFAGKVIYEA